MFFDHFQSSQLLDTLIYRCDIGSPQIPINIEIIYQSPNIRKLHTPNGNYRFLREISLNREYCEITKLNEYERDRCN